MCSQQDKKQLQKSIHEIPLQFTQVTTTTHTVETRRTDQPNTSKNDDVHGYS